MKLKAVTVAVSVAAISIFFACRDFDKTYEKKGNNGTVTCSTFCAGKDWGVVGKCFAGFKASTKENVPCDVLLGHLPNNDTVICVCQK